MGQKFNPFTSNFDIVLDKASEITNTPSGNLAATNVQSALNELQGDIDTINTDIADDVEGPASSTDNAIARFDGTTGKLLQNSTVTIDDSGNASDFKTIQIRNDDELSSPAENMVRLENRNDSPTSHGHIEFRRSRASHANLANGDEIGGLNFHPRHNSNTLTAAEILAIYTGDGTTRSADLSFLTSNSGAPTEKMRLTAAGSLQLSALTTSRALVTDGSKGLSSSATTSTEIGFVSGVTSSIQTQIDSKQATITGAATTIVTSNLTASRALVSDGSGKVAAATTTATEIGYVNGVSSSIQTQIDSKQPLLRTIIDVNSNVTLTAHAIHLVDTSAARSLTLPAAPATGTQIILKDVTGSVNVNNITIVRAASETIEGVAASYVIDMIYQSITLISDASGNWWII